MRSSSRASGGAEAQAASSHARSVSPSSSSIAYQGLPASAPRSSMRTTSGCRARRSASTSRRIDATRSGEVARTRLSATGCPVSTCRARYTTPMPPSPSTSPSS
ncbi:MAG: hypothetical protein R3A52_11300 [Polyangiales bacterium]